MTNSQPTSDERGGRFITAAIILMVIGFVVIAVELGGAIGGILDGLWR